MLGSDGTSSDMRSAQLELQQQQGDHQPSSTIASLKAAIAAATSAAVTATEAPTPHDLGHAHQCHMQHSQSMMSVDGLSGMELARALTSWKSEQPRVCGVCLDDSHDADHNRLLVCSSSDCDVCVHEECYGIAATPDHEEARPWLCDHCEFRSHQDDINVDPFDKSRVHCVLCPQPGGPLKRIASGNAWVHVACAIWTPEVEIQDVDKLSGIDVRRVPSARWNDYCYLCTEKADAAVGACMRCTCSGCSKSFHVSCALKWGLLEDMLAHKELEGVTDDLGISFEMACHLHKPIPTQPMLHSLEKWRLRRPVTASEAQQQHREQEMFASVPAAAHQQSPTSKTAFDLFLEATIGQALRCNERVVTLKEKFEHQYAIYDEERVKAVRLLAEENEQLLRQRPELESAIVTMKNELVDVANAVDGAQNVNEAYRQRIQEMRGALVQFYLLARKQDLDLRLLTEEGAEAATRLASIPGSPTSRLANTRALGKSSIVDFEALPEMITPEEAVAFFLKLNGTAQELAPLDPDVDGCTVLQLPSLSQIDGSDLPMAPARPTDIEARRLAPHRCESCHVRQLPVTAPVMPAHRDRLLLCTTCGLRFHLCCVEPPLRELPEQEDSWACSFCVLGAALAMEVEEEEEAQRIAEDVAIAATSKSRPFRARRDSLSTETHMDMFFEDGYAHLEAEEAERQRRQLVQQQRVEIVQQRRNSLPARRRNNSTSSMQAPPTVKKARANRNSANAIEQNSAVATASPSIAAPALVTDKSLEEAKSVLKRIMGRAPACPTLLLQRQNIAKAEDVALRAFVHDIVSPEDHEQLKRHSMWRILNSVPPKTDPADVLALVREGAAVGFGKCLDAVEDPSVLASLNVDDFTFGDNNGNVMAIDRDASDRNLCDFTSTSGAELAATAAGPNSGLRPERQQTRWNGDLYKPLWTRGQGKAKEGWCGLCEPGIWLKTKTSVYWYHMHNYHGISSIAGDYFAPPTDYRSAPGTGLREAHCDQCKKWIPVQSEKPVNVEEIYWFKHAQKCHQATAEEE